MCFSFSKLGAAGRNAKHVRWENWPSMPRGCSVRQNNKKQEQQMLPRRRLTGTSLKHAITTSYAQQDLPYSALSNETRHTQPRQDEANTTRKQRLSKALKNNTAQKKRNEKTKKTHVFMVHRRLSEESGGVTLRDIQGAVRRSGGRGDSTRRVKILRLSELVGERLRLVNRACDGLVLVVKVLGLVARVVIPHSARRRWRRGSRQTGINEDVSISCFYESLTRETASSCQTHRQASAVTATALETKKQKTTPATTTKATATNNNSNPTNSDKQQ